MHCSRKLIYISEQNRAKFLPLLNLHPIGLYRDNFKKSIINKLHSIFLRSWIAVRKRRNWERGMEGSGNLKEGHQCRPC